MRIRIRLAVTLLIFIFSAIGCQSETELPMDMPGVDVSLDDANTQMELMAPEGWNTFKPGEHIVLAIKVISNNHIAVDCNLPSVYLYLDQKWAEIDDLSTCIGETTQIIPPTKDDYFSMGSVDILPDLPDPSQAVTLRILVIGNIVRDGVITDEQTTAYIDVELTP